MGPVSGSRSEAEAASKIYMQEKKTWKQSEIQQSQCLDLYNLTDTLLSITIWQQVLPFNSSSCAVTQCEQHYLMGWMS